MQEKSIYWSQMWQCPKRFLTADMASRRFFERRLSGLLWRHWENLGKPIRAQESDAKPYDVIGKTWEN